MKNLTAQEKKKAYLQRLKNEESKNSSLLKPLIQNKTEESAPKVIPNLISEDFSSKNDEKIKELNEEIELLRKQIESATKEKNEIISKFQRTTEFVKESLREKELISSENRTLRISRIMSETGILLNSLDDKWSESPNEARLNMECENDKKYITSTTPEFVKTMFAKKKELGKETLRRIDEKRKIVHNLISMSTSSLFPSKIVDDGKVILIEPLGSGGFGHVWKAWDFNLAKFVAIKIIAMPDYTSIDKYVIHIKREMDIMQSTDHKNVVKMFRYFYLDDNTVAYVIEYCEKGNLFEAIRDAGKIQEKEAHEILVQIINGLLALKSKPNEDSKASEVVIHYDLKPANIVFDGGFTPKICDFGLSKIANEDKSILQSTAGSGTPGYTAPEAFLNRSKINYSADTWSIGIMYLEMLSGNFETKKEISTADQSKIDQIVSAVFASNRSQVSKEAVEFIKTCLEREPNARPTVKILSTMPYITGFSPQQTKGKRSKSSK